MLIWDAFIQVVAVAARSLKSAEEFNKKFGFETAKAYEGYKSLAGDSEVSFIHAYNIMNYDIH